MVKQSAKKKSENFLQKLFTKVRKACIIVKDKPMNGKKPEVGCSRELPPQAESGMRQSRACAPVRSVGEGRLALSV